jgi:hypothetical protein
VERRRDTEERGPRVVRIMDLAERAAYFGVALFLVATIVMVFVSIYGKVWVDFERA